MRRNTKKILGQENCSTQFFAPNVQLQANVYNSSVDTDHTNIGDITD